MVISNRLQPADMQVPASDFGKEGQIFPLSVINSIRILRKPSKFITQGLHEVETDTADLPDFFSQFSQRGASY